MSQVSGTPYCSLGAVLRITVRTTFKHHHVSNPLQSVYSQAGETNVTAADALVYLPPRDGITCLSIDSGSPGRPLLKNAISCHCCAEGNACKHCKAANCSCNCVKLSFHRVKLGCLCTASDLCRNSFIKKEDETGSKNSTNTTMGMT